MLCIFLASPEKTLDGGANLSASQVIEFLRFRQVDPPDMTSPISGSVDVADIVALIMVTNRSDDFQPLLISHRGNVQMARVDDPWLGHERNLLIDGEAIRRTTHERIRNTGSVLTFYPRESTSTAGAEPIELSRIPASCELINVTPGESMLDAPDSWLPYSTWQLNIPPGPDRTYLIAVQMQLTGENYVNLVPESSYFSIDGVHTLQKSIKWWDLLHPDFKNVQWLNHFEQLERNTIRPDQYDVAIASHSLGGRPTYQESENFYVKRLRSLELEMYHQEDAEEHEPEFDYFITSSDQFCLRVGILDQRPQAQHKPGSLTLVC